MNVDPILQSSTPLWSIDTETLGKAVKLLGQLLELPFAFLRGRQKYMALRAPHADGPFDGVWHGPIKRTVDPAFSSQVTLRLETVRGELIGDITYDGHVLKISRALVKNRCLRFFYDNTRGHAAHSGCATIVLSRDGNSLAGGYTGIALDCDEEVRGEVFLRRRQ